MRITEVAKLFAGSCIVYLVVAACGAYAGDERSSSSGGSSGAASSSGTTPDSTIVDPVANALAEGHKSGSRLKLRFYEGADGSRQFIDFFDTQFQTECQVPRNTGDGKVRCLPSPAGSPVWTTAACAGAATLYQVDKTSPQPKVIVLPAVNSTPVAMFEVGALTTPPAKVYVSFGAIGAGCTEVPSTGAAYNYYAIGAPISDSAFVEMSIKTE